MLTIRFVVNGETVPVDVDECAPLLVGMRAALEASNNTARPLESWELRDEIGRLLDRATSAADNRIADKAHLYITLYIGAGG